MIFFIGFKGLFLGLRYNFFLNYLVSILKLVFILNVKVGYGYLGLFNIFIDIKLVFLSF